MCTVAIVDANLLWKVAPAPQRQGDSELRTWIRQRHGILAYSKSRQYYEELSHSPRAWRVFEEYRRGQHAILIRDSELASAAEILRNTPIRCNDRHVLELALASDTLVLCSNDNDLKNDFTRVDVLPGVGRRSRVLYPVDASPDKRRAFLHAHKCPNRAMN